MTNCRLPESPAVDISASSLEHRLAAVQAAYTLENRL